MTPRQKAIRFLLDRKMIDQNGAGANLSAPLLHNIFDELEKRVGITVAEETAAPALDRDLRDWFAGQALAGASARGKECSNPHELAEYAYICADAMLKARKDQT